MDRCGIFIALGVAGVSCAGLAAKAATAAEVFRCVGPSGQVAFQDHRCAANQHGDRVELAASPAFVPSPVYAGSKASHATASGRGRHDSARSAARNREAQSYECRAANGDVFYKHSACPKSIRVAASGRRGEKARLYEVSGVAVPRRDACERMQHSAGRAGRDRDDGVSTYERNEGRDVCR